jgi:hypothetical protein
VRRIVEPERKAYERSALGPDSFEFAGVGWRKRELTLTTTDGVALQAVHWEPAEKSVRLRPCPPCCSVALS